VDCFVYGTLTDPETATRVLGDAYEYGPELCLSGLHRLDGRYPTLAPGGHLDGRLLRSPRDDALDAYEGVDSGLYVRVPAPRETGGSAEVYVGDPDRLGLDMEWLGDGSFAERVRRYVEEEGVVVRPLD
jgi:gamma-glutamylcyclotransferase (GGCT)/AIG2-like uncharacterized protein YtfP